MMFFEKATIAPEPSVSAASARNESVVISAGTALGNVDRARLRFKALRPNPSTFRGPPVLVAIGGVAERDDPAGGIELPHVGLAGLAHLLARCPPREVELGESNHPIPLAHHRKD